MKEGKSIVTNYTNHCIICGDWRVDEHHLFYGTSGRAKSDKYGLVVPLCRFCHYQIHNEKVAGSLSKIVAELAFERQYIADNNCDIETAMREFRREFGSNRI